MHDGSGPWSYVAILALLLTTAFAGRAAADQIRLHNGDRLTGTLVKLEQGVLTLQTGYAEKLEIQAEAVQSIATDRPVSVRLQGGEVLTGALEGGGESLQVAAGPERGATRIAWSRIVSINVPPPPPWNWRGNLFLGANWQSGNSDRTSASFGGEATRRSAKERFSLSLLYNYAEEQDQLSARDSFGALKYDHFFTQAFYGYLGVELLKDRFKDLNLRTVVGPGLGYQLWDDPLRELALEAGLAFFSEDRIQAADDQWLTARLGARLRYQLSDRIRFTDNLSLFPNLEAGGEFTSRNEATLLTSLSGPWSLRLANVWEHDSNPAPGIRKNDAKSSLSLQYSF